MALLLLGSPSETLVDFIHYLYPSLSKGTNSPVEIIQERKRIRPEKTGRENAEGMFVYIGSTED